MLRLYMHEILSLENQGYASVGGSKSNRNLVFQILRVGCGRKGDIDYLGSARNLCQLTTAYRSNPRTVRSHLISSSRDSRKPHLQLSVICAPLLVKDFEADTV